jgi:hypothetical protein
MGPARARAVRLVTVTRSQGDGFLPLGLWPLVEWHSLCALQRAFARLDVPTRFTFDPTTNGTAPAVEPMPCVLKHVVLPDLD